MGSLILKFIVGGIAGLLVWMIFEPAAPKSVMGSGWERWEATYIMALGALVGLAIGGLDGFTRGGKQHTIRGLLMGGFLGAIGASFGHGIGGVVVHGIFGPLAFSRSMIAVIPARILAFVFIGIALGAAIGFSSLNVKKGIQGAIGGGIGAAIAGALFDPVSTVLANFMLASRGVESGEVGGPGRAIMALLLGAAIALFIGIVDRLSRSAWLRLVLGRNEGKEWSIDGSQTFIGRSEGAHVPLFGDNNVAPIHASIQKQAGQYILVDGGSPVGTLVNGQRVMQPTPLFPGAQIQIGSFNLVFLVKNAPAPATGPEPYRGQAYPMQGAPGQPQPQMHPQAGMPTQAMPQQMPGGMPTQVMPQQMPSGMPTQVLPSMGGQPTMAYAAPMQQARPASLVAIDGPLMGQRFAVQGPMDLGRDCPAIPMSFDSAASRRHANISPAPNGLAVTDVGSTNGTFVNGQRVSQAMAGPGDLVKIGSTTFRVEA